jgi:hypothetical protein
VSDNAAGVLGLLILMGAFIVMVIADAWGKR